MARSRIDFAEFKNLLVLAWNEWNNDQAPRLGAAVAFYTLLSLAPLLILLIAVAGLVFGTEAARGELFHQIRDMVGAEGAQAVQNMVDNAARPGAGIIASLIGFAVLIFGASTVAAELKNSFNLLWNLPPATAGGLKGMVKTRSTALVVVLGCGFLLLVSLVVSSFVAAAGTFMGEFLPVPEWLLHLINTVVGWVIITGVFAVLFRYLPDVDVEWSDVLLGAAFTSVLFSVGKFLIGLYLGKASFGSTYGAAGSLVIVLMWVYYSAQILFFGAEFTQVYAERHGSDPQRKRLGSEVPPTAALPAVAPLTASSAAGNAGLATRPDEKAAGMFGSLLGSALALRRIVRGFRR